jgi:Heparan-alpha-glucosaminide N-acetyltransferase, catalytic
VTVRHVSIDILRTFAIVMMVLVHFLENLAGAVWTPAGFGAPLFTFLVGVSYRLWVNAQEAKGKEDSEISRVTVRRGVFLFVLGFAFNVLVWLPGDTFNWDVLTLIGTAFFVLNIVRNLPPAVPLVMAAAAFALAPVLREMTDYNSFWPDTHFDPDWTLYDLLVGYLAGRAFFAGGPGEEPPTGRTALIGAGMLGLALACVALRQLAPDLFGVRVLRGWTMFPPSVEYVTGTIGFALLTFSLGRRWLDPRAELLEGSRLLAIASVFSKYSLSIYVLHHVVHLWPLWVYGAFAGGEPTEFWMKATPVWATIPLTALFLIASYFLFRWMDRTGRDGIEGWLRRM